MMTRWCLIFDDDAISNLNLINRPTGLRYWWPRWLLDHFFRPDMAAAAVVVDPRNRFV